MHLRAIAMERQKLRQAEELRPTLIAGALAEPMTPLRANAPETTAAWLPTTTAAHNLPA